LSSILKALKKIEGRRVDTRPPSWPYRTGGPNALDAHIRRFRQHQKILGILIVLCVAALAGKIYLGRQSDSESGISKSAPPAETVPAGKSTEAKKTVVVAPKNPAAPTSWEAFPPEPAAPSMEALPEAVTASSEADVAPSPSVSSPAAAEADSSKTSVPEIYDPPPADAATLSLQALVWSGESGKRFAVINGSIVREGGSIENSTVVRIEGDYLVMRTGGSTWKLK